MDTQPTQGHKNPLVRITLLIVILLLLGGNVYMFLHYQDLARGSLPPNTILEKNTKVVAFTELLVSLLLKSDTVTDDDRIALESAVRDLDDEEILQSWKTFTASDSETLAQKNLVILLETLLSKIDTKKTLAQLCSVE